MLVHFPIALGLLGCLFEFTELFFRKEKKPCRCGECILYFAVLSAILALLAGAFFTPDFTGKANEVKNIHGAFAGITLTLFCITAGIYLLNRLFLKDRRIVREIGFAIYVLAAISVAITGLLGGTLVYDYMIK